MDEVSLRSLSATILLPEARPGIPYVLDPEADGSLAHLVKSNRHGLNQMTSKAQHPAARALALAAMSGHTGYRAFVEPLLGPEFLKAAGWDDATCRKWVINHERAHIAMADLSKHDPCPMGRLADMFDENGQANVDGVALLWTLAELNLHQALELERIALHLEAAGQSSASANFMAAKRKIESLQSSGSSGDFSSKNAHSNQSGGIRRPKSRS